MKHIIDGNGVGHRSYLFIYPLFSVLVKMMSINVDEFMLNIN